MALPYKRNFVSGRQSEQFLNDNFHIIYEVLKNINYRKNEHSGIDPDAAKVDGALWFDKTDELLKYFDSRSASWKTAFSRKFQVTDQMLNATMPNSPVVGQLWIFNGTLLYFDGAAWQPIKAAAQDGGQWSNAVFEDYIMMSPMNNIGDNVAEQEIDNHKYHNIIEPSKTQWESEEWELLNHETPEKTEIPEDLRSQFLIPNINTDRLFVDHDFDENYEKVSTNCVQYQTKYISDKVVTGIHMNPGKLSKITKKLIKVDKESSTINLPAYNTEFYGYRKGDFKGDLLLQSKSQDYGDYIPVGDSILLNYNAVQNYDYILAVKYEFAWAKSNGVMNKFNLSGIESSFFISNLKEPINIHSDGLKLEEAIYEVDYNSGVVKINDDDIENTHVQMWSPYKKQFGYIRETTLDGMGIIKLKKKVFIPLVFVGGTLIHPLYGGLKYDGDKIYVPNQIAHNSMINMSWCVIDLVNDKYESMYQERGKTEVSAEELNIIRLSYFDDEDNYVLSQSKWGELREDGFKEYIINSGELSDENKVIIKYNKNKITEEDGIILFIDGLMISEDCIERDHENGIITLKDDVLVQGQEYLLLKDHDGLLYKSSTLIPAYNTGYINDSLLYMDGKLLCNQNCVTTTRPEDEETPRSVDNEIKFFLKDSTDLENGTWKFYNEWDYSWDELTEREIKDIELIVSSYSNQLSSIKINVEYDSAVNKMDVYTFKLANANSGIYKNGSARFIEEMPDGSKLYALGLDTYAYGQNVLNIFKNGVKLEPGFDFKEYTENNYIKIYCDADEVEDSITYIIEPIEVGETFAKETIIMNQDDIIQKNIYSAGEGDSVASLYPGRVTVYVNGLRLPKEKWILLDNKRIMLNFDNYISLGTEDNYPKETFTKDGNIFEVNHTYPDHIMVEIRKDYDRRENTIILEDNDFEISIEKYGLPIEILESEDEVLFYLNGQYLGLSRSKNLDYKLNIYKACISLLNPDAVSMLTVDNLKILLDRNALIYAEWKKKTGKDKYVPKTKNELTLVWR